MNAATSPGSRRRRPPEAHARHEGGDEARPAEWVRDPVRERRAGDRDDLQPRVGDQPAAPGEHDHGGRRHAGGHATHDPVADLLQYHGERVMAAREVGVDVRCGQNDQQQRDADSVVEPALDVEPLTHAERQPGLGDHRLAQRGVRWCQQDGEHQRLGEAQLVEEEGGQERAGSDREGKADPEQPHRQVMVAAQSTQVDPRGVGEEDQRERRLGEGADRFTQGREVHLAEHPWPDEDSDGHEDHRRRDGRAREAARERGHDENRGGDNGEAPVHVPSMTVRRRHRAFFLDPVKAAGPRVEER